jgi:hypothetical protein
LNSGKQIMSGLRERKKVDSLVGNVSPAAAVYTQVFKAEAFKVEACWDLAQLIYVLTYMRY